jgi:cobalamin synthase
MDGAAIATAMLPDSPRYRLQPFKLHHRHRYRSSSALLAPLLKPSRTCWITKTMVALSTVFTILKPNVTILMSELLVCSQSSAWAALFTMTIGGHALQFFPTMDR